jgi:hypothetical protein
MAKPPKPKPKPPKTVRKPGWPWWPGKKQIKSK